MQRALIFSTSTFSDFSFYISLRYTQNKIAVNLSTNMEMFTSPKIWCFEGENEIKLLISCTFEWYTYIMIYMVRKLWSPRKFWHQSWRGLKHLLSARIFSTLRVMVATHILESLFRTFIMRWIRRNVDLKTLIIKY